ncbi:MAG: hypothetical protein ACQESE_01560 [Nanobdellota archaeon]
MSQDMNTLTETLFNSGLAGSPGEARRMAEEMLSTSKKVAESSEENQQTNFAVKRYKRPEKKPEERTAEQQPTDNETAGYSSSLDPQKRESYNKEFRDRALSNRPIDVQVEFDTPRRNAEATKNKYLETQNAEKYKQQFQASDIPDTHSEYKSPETSRAPNSEDQSIDRMNTTAEQFTDHSAAEQTQEHNAAEQKVAHSETEEPTPQFSNQTFSTGSLLDQAIRRVESSKSSDSISPEEYSSKNIEEENTSDPVQQPEHSTTDNHPQFSEHTTAEQTSNLSSNAFFPDKNSEAENNIQDTDFKSQFTASSPQMTAPQNQHHSTTDSNAHTPENQDANTESLSSDAKSQSRTSGQRREMTEEEKKQQEEVDLTKHFNFSNN